MHLLHILSGMHFYTLLGVDGTPLDVRLQRAVEDARVSRPHEGMHAVHDQSVSSALVLFLQL